ncbi:MAG: UpxY family transcription antiterminator [Alistipes sp.]|nr:UpxY family transcription antiterminator [Alistipes sp.]
MNAEIKDIEKYWYALRDLKRSNAIYPAYKQLRELGIEVFTPMKWRMTKRNGRQFGREVPVMPDLLFAHDTRKILDPIVAQTPTLQYRFKKGGTYCEPIIVPEEDMNRFIGAVRAAEDPKYYSAEEIDSLMTGKNIRIVGGAMDGQEGKLLTVRGSKVKRIVIKLPNLLALSVKVEDEYIQIID